MAKAPTITDIARAANVSPSTVSRVLTGSSPVAQEKRVAVLDAIERLHFRPNFAARSLVNGKSMAVGVLTQSVTSQFYGELAKGVEQGLRGSAYHSVFSSGQWEIDEEQAALDLLIGRQVDALIVLGGFLADAVLREVNNHMPVIGVGRTIVGLELQSLVVGDYDGAYRATRHLLNLGHRRIAHIAGILSHPDAQERRRGYEQALLDAGIEVDEQLIVEGSYMEQSGLLAVDALLVRASQFTAVFAANDQLAYGARLALYRRGLRVPDDISLIGFDDQPHSAFTVPPLTTMRQHMFEMGFEAAAGILRMLDGQPPALPTFSATLIVRESTSRLR